MKLKFVILAIVVLSVAAEEEPIREKRTLDKLLHHFVPPKPAPKPKPQHQPAFSLNTLWQGLQKHNGGAPLIQIQFRPSKPAIQPVFQLGPAAPALPPPQQQQIPLPNPQPQLLQKFAPPQPQGPPPPQPPPAPQPQFAPAPIQAPLPPALPSPAPTPAAFGLGKLLSPLGINFGQQQPPQPQQPLPPAPAPQPLIPVQPVTAPVKVTVNVNSHGSAAHNDHGHGPIEVVHTPGFKKEIFVDKKNFPVDQSNSRYTTVNFPSKHGQGHQYDVNVFNKHVDVFGAQNFNHGAPTSHFSSASTFPNLDHAHQSHSSVTFHQNTPVFSTSGHGGSNHFSAATADFDNSRHVEKTVFVEQSEPVITTYQEEGIDCGSDGHNHHVQHQLIGGSFGEHDTHHHRHY